MCVLHGSDGTESKGNSEVIYHARIIRTVLSFTLGVKVPHCAPAVAITKHAGDIFAKPTDKCLCGFFPLLENARGQR